MNALQSAMNLSNYGVTTFAEVDKLSNEQIRLLSESAGGLGHMPMVKVNGGIVLLTVTGNINLLESNGKFYLRAGKGAQVNAETFLNELIGNPSGAALTETTCASLVRLWRQGRMDSASSLNVALSGAIAA
jgi:hypothetical protein